jgi:hypothetical protein
MSNDMTERELIEELRGEYTGQTVRAAADKIEILGMGMAILVGRVAEVEGQLAAARADMETWPGRLGDAEYDASIAARSDKRMGALEPVPVEARALVDDLRRTGLPVDDSELLRRAAATEIERTRGEIGWAKGRIVFLEGDLFERCKPELERYQKRTKELERRLRVIREAADGKGPA